MLQAILGGALLGTAAGSLFLLRGRVAGIGGAVSSLANWGESDDWAHQALFVVGLLVAGVVIHAWQPSSLEQIDVPYGIVGLAGLLVGFGMRRGGGCTSGHGVCGIARLSKRSLLATMTFMATGALTVLVTRHLLGRP